jgi:hypothetical protein
MGAPGCAGLTRATEITFLEDSCLWTDPLSNTLDVVDVVERTAVGRVRVHGVSKLRVGCGIAARPGLVALSSKWVKDSEDGEDEGKEEEDEEDAKRTRRGRRGAEGRRDFSRWSGPLLDSWDVFVRAA